MTAALLSGSVPSGWEVVEFGTLLEGGTRNGVYKPSQYHGRGAKIVNMGELFAFPRLHAVEMQRVELSVDEAGRFDLRRGDLLFARRSLVDKGAGRCSIVCELDGPTTFESSIIRARPNPAVADGFYLYYLFQSRVGRNLLGSIRRQTSVSGITGSDLVRLRVPVPPRDEQHAISSLLDTLDRKVEVNRCQNHTLEAIARAVFRSWFVDFDPVVAKAEGRQPFGMDAETAALFPSRFVESELGSIPDGWSVGRVAEVCTTQYGYTASATQDPAGPHFLRVTDINKRPWIEWNSVPYCAPAEDIRRIYGLRPGDVVVSRMADPGKAAIIEEQVDAVFASYLVRLTTTNDLAHYLFYFLTSEQYLDYVAGARTGTVQQNMNARIITAAPMLIPARAVARAFSEIATPLRNRIVANVKEDHTLTELRDTLLPKLLSGEIRVRDAEQKVEAAL